jgi:hypothetical protein
MKHIELLIRTHAYLRGATINNSSSNTLVDRDQLARDITEYLNNQHQPCSAQSAAQAAEPLKPEKPQTV